MGVWCKYTCVVCGACVGMWCVYAHVVCGACVGMCCVYAHVVCGACVGMWCVYAHVVCGACVGVWCVCMCAGVVVTCECDIWACGVYIWVFVCFPRDYQFVYIVICFSIPMILLMFKSRLLSSTSYLKVLSVHELSPITYCTLMYLLMCYVTLVSN